jgi:anti-sigma regulatory factor (Ser/Thr protein kinase)
MKEISLHILDIVQNSIRAKASEVSLAISESDSNDLYTISVTDNGAGIPENIIDTVTDPFVTTRTKRRMGLGLPLLKYHAEMTGGNLDIESEPGKGTKITASFSNHHIDRQPLGDIVGTLIILIAANPGIEFLYNHSTDKGSYSFSTAETKEYLGLTSLYDRELLEDLAEMLGENLKEIGVSGFKLKEKV